MKMVKRAVPLAVSLAVVCLTTAILWSLRMAGDELRHPVFLYLLPIAVLAIFFGSLAALVCAPAATACAVYFLYEPLYTFRMANGLEIGDLVVFLVLALFGVKCTEELLRPRAKTPATERSAIRTPMPADPVP
jgi:K+-sensing histidine kinase KdpD